MISDLYLDLLEQTLTGIILKDPGYAPSVTPVPGPYNAESRSLGMDWPLNAQTMVGVPRLKNLRACISQIIQDSVPGDLIETGVWRGGACIYMRAVLAVHGDTTRRVWVADSFEGLPPPDVENFPQDLGDPLHMIRELAVSVEEVRENFAKYNLLDDQVMFLKGFFKDSLPSAPIKQLSLLRLDGDMYESTIESLDSLYQKLSPGGFVIVDDFSLPNCRRAIEDFRAAHGINDVLEAIDQSSSFWRKSN